MPLSSPSPLEFRHQKLLVEPARKSPNTKEILLNVSEPKPHPDCPCHLNKSTSSPREMLIGRWADGVSQWGDVSGSDWQAYNFDYSCFFEWLSNRAVTNALVRFYDFALCYMTFPAVLRMIDRLKLSEKILIFEVVAHWFTLDEEECISKLHRELIHSFCIFSNATFHSEKILSFYPLALKA